VNGCYVVQKNERGYVHIKASHEVNHLLYDVAEHIINVVKNNFSTWFNSQMSEDLVDDFFSHPLTYDKKYGDVIRAKVDNVDIVTDLNQRSNLVLVLNHIRIYKQKFQLEWTIESIECSSDDVSDDEGFEIPLDEIKQEYIEKLSQKIDVLNEQLALLKTCDNKNLVATLEGVLSVLEA